MIEHKSVPSNTAWTAGVSRGESPGAGGGGRRMPMLGTTATGGPPTAGRPSSRRPGPTNAKNRSGSGATSGSAGAAEGPAQIDACV